MTELAERDTRVETLAAGDRFRWLRRWYTVERLQFTGPRNRVAVVTTERSSFLFPVGHFVAAEPAERP